MTDPSAASVTRSDHSIVVRVQAPVAAETVFARLTDPQWHVRLDGSGTVRGAVDPHQITAAGQKFVMEMYFEDRGHYRTENTVLEVVPGRRVAWTVARVGNPPAGVRWQWDVEPADEVDGAAGSLITHTYDWAEVTDPVILGRIPRVSAEEMEQTIARLVDASR
ncbi:uncharacterized protein YndB with AHSA1/START domain [Nakamurella flavida]|uniref:SRPBCC family protein n=1 Tax=Nakamurella flavida TaxID=363630 RepID=UPI002784134C|nr:SRPBCC family protein [Nakamurella flavida]MDP9778500.1 uncharacterized protein YndB with AHSA1/START domain [Nakamurella flavida]